MSNEKYFGATGAQREEIVKRHNIANTIYKTMSLKNKEVLYETRRQITFCVQFGKLLTETQIKEMLLCKSEFQVERKARTYKYA